MALTRATDKIIANPDGNLNLSGIVTASSFVGSGSGLTGVASTDHIKTSTTANFTDGIQVGGATTLTGALTGTTGTFSGAISAASATITGNLGVGGVITYEDVTNIDSVGVVTARSGIKIGPTAGVAGTFFADGSYITAGIITATTFHGDGSNLTGIDTDLVSDTSPQLGADLDVNNFNIKNGTAILDISTNQRFEFNVAGTEVVDINGGGVDITSGHVVLVDNVKAKFGNGGDMEIYHDGTDNYIRSNNGAIILRDDTIHLKAYSTTDTYLSATNGGAVSLRYDNSTKFATTNTGAVVTGILTATSFSGSGANLTSLRANRNLIINGDCSVCQYRGITGETTGVGVLTTDRWHLGYSGHDEDLTQEHRNNPVTDAPSKLGISHSFQVKNGNQTSTGSSDYARISYTIESQYMRNSGWDFQNPNSYVTLSFWCKSSISKNFYGMVFCQDSPFKQRSFETGTLTAHTWTKVEISIPGTSGMNFDHDTGPGFIIYWYLYSPTSYTSGNGPLNTWMGYNSTKFTPTDSDAWWTADNATFDITGVQLEVGNVATPFELKNYEQNLWECKRYYQRSTDQNRGSNYSLQSSTWHSADGVQSFNKHSNYYDFKQNFEREMRVAPTLTIYGSSNQGDIHLESVGVGSKQVDWNNNTTEVKTKGFLLRHIEDQSDGNYTSGSGNAFGILAYTLDAEF